MSSPDHTTTDPTIRLPGFCLSPWRQRSLLNRFYTGQVHCSTRWNKSGLTPKCNVWLRRHSDDVTRHRLLPPDQILRWQSTMSTHCRWGCCWLGITQSVNFACHRTWVSKQLTMQVGERVGKRLCHRMRTWNRKTSTTTTVVHQWQCQSIQAGARLPSDWNNEPAT